MFDDRPTLASPRLVLAPLAEADLAPLAAAMGDPLIWEQHPARDRWRPEVAAPYARWLLEAGGTLVARDPDGRAIGCSRFYVADDLPPGGIAIGYTFLVRDHWGGPTNFEMKRLMLAHLFRTADEAWFHIAADNLRSQRAAEKLGAARRGRSALSVGGRPVAHLVYALTRPDWERTLAARAA